MIKTENTYVILSGHEIKIMILWLKYISIIIFFKLNITYAGLYKYIHNSVYN